LRKYTVGWYVDWQGWKLRNILNDVGWGRWKCWKVETRQNNGWNEMESGRGKHWMIRIHWIGKGQWMNESWEEKDWRKLDQSINQNLDVTLIDFNHQILKYDCTLTHQCISCISIEECGIVLPMRQNVRGLKVAIRKYSLKVLMQLIPFEGLYNYMRLYKLGMRGGNDVLTW